MMMSVKQLVFVSLLGMTVNSQRPANASSSTCGSPKTQTVLRSQVEVAAISLCTSVAGSLALNGTGISDLKPLQNLRRIEASLEIIGTGLKNLGGLGSLQSLGESLAIHNNELLENLGGLEALVNVSGGISIHENSRLTSLDGLSNLTLVSTNQTLIGESDGLALASLPLLTSLSGLGRITTLGNGLVLENLPALSSLAGLSTANLTLRNLTLSDIPQLKSLEELFNTGSGSLIPASLKLTYLPALVSLKGLEGFTEVSNLVILHNGALSDVRALSTTKFTGPLLFVDDNGSLCDFAGLQDTAAQVNGSQVFNTCGKATTNVNGSTTAPVSRNSGKLTMDPMSALSLGPLFLTILSFLLF